VEKSPEIDGINGIFIKDGASILKRPISNLCNLSIKLATVPNECKVAKLKPLFKKGKKTDPKNYRPISLLPLVSKIFEKIVHDQTQKYLKDNQILYKYQSGFRSGHSTDTCLAYLNNFILRGFDQGLVTGMILIDLQKAFDTIDHKILLDKLSVMGFSNSAIKWFKSYLSNRYFKISIDKELSKPGLLDCGVPQGSILGPLLFLIYVNDMPRSIKLSKLLLYADDSCLLFQGKSVDEIIVVLNNDFSDLCDWFVDNKLSIHFGEDKTKSILFCPKRKRNKIDPLKIEYKNLIIKQHSNVSYLVCMLDDSLNGESMALNVLKKINSRLAFLYQKKTKNFWPLISNACYVIL
jgi:retron-type reverse transcriptase